MSQLTPQSSQGSADSAHIDLQHRQHDYHSWQQQQRMHNQQTNLPASPSSPTLPSSASFSSTSSFSSPSPTQRSRDGRGSPQHTYRQSYGPSSSALLQTSLSSSAPLSSRSRKAAPSPLHMSTVAPSTTINPSAFNFPFAASPSLGHLQGAEDSRTPNVVPLIVTSLPRPVADSADQFAETEKTYFDSASSGDASPTGETSQSPTISPISPRTPNDHRSVSESVVSSKPLSGATVSSRAAMAGSSATRHAEATNGVPRNSSIDSGVSALSNGSGQRKGSTDGDATSHDIPSIIKAAGSPEAVIEHLLKEKHAQYQQNAQLWRLVDKQRAMILGLNKDLERALKDKERYRKKLKETLAGQTRNLSTTPASSSTLIQEHRSRAVDNDEMAEEMAAPTAVAAKTTVSEYAESPIEPTPIRSPVDVSMAPYPITPPADQPSHAPSTVAGDLLDPVSSMPRPQDHALDNFDLEAEDRAADSVRKIANSTSDLLINFSLPPSRSLPSIPPQVPPPRIPPPPPPVSSASTKAIDESIEQFPSPPPPPPPPRKAPPAPLLLRDLRASLSAPIDDEVLESDSDYDSLLEVTEIRETDKRGRRRTREEDDREREILARKEAEIRSLSKKSKQSSSAHDAATNTISGSVSQIEVPIITQTVVLQPLLDPTSLDGVLTTERGGQSLLRRNFSAPMLSPGLPSSPRPVGHPKSPMHSPPMSPRLAPGFPSVGPVPLSPRPPRQAIPLPPNTPLQTPSPAPATGEPLRLVTSKTLNDLKAGDLSMLVPSSPSTKSENSLDSPAGQSVRMRIFKGFVTEEYPDLLLPPNALPSVDIKVASSRMKPSRASLLSLTQLEEDPVFTLAVFSRADGGELWRVEKDSLSLIKLDQRMKQCASFTARTPDRSLFSGHAPAKLDARRQALDSYLDELVNTPLDTNTAIELCRYLSTSTLPPNADENGSASPVVAKEGKVITHKTGAGGRPLMAGYLTKRGKNFGGWKARFFVLDGPVLKYYETPGGAHLGSIKLRNAQIGKQSQNSDNSSPGRPGGGTNDDLDNQYRHAFLILEPKKKDPSALTKHVLCAESDRERDQWVDTLLRWIDYRDPDDDDDVPVNSRREPERQQGTHGAHDGSRPSTSSASKKKFNPVKKPRQHQNSSADSKDGLIGMSYDNVQAGETPQGAPGSRHPESEAPQSTMSQSPYAISAPRDPQVLTESTPWTNRALLGGGLAPPSVEEKKARKRSFFGFGPKTRTPGEGSQDTLFGESNGGTGHGNVSNGGYGGPIRQVFGAPLAEAVHYNSPTDVRVPLPAVVYRCIQYLDARGATTEEGIFRLSGSNIVIKQLRERFNNESDVNLLVDTNYYDIHAVASLLKMYLRELPTTILTRELHNQFLTVTEMSDQDEKLAALGELALRLPEANATLLKYLIAFLIKIINRADKNKMTVRNVGIVFSPTLNIPAPVFAMLLQNYAAIFGIEPEEYELSSPAADGLHQQHPSVTSLEIPQRQSTAQASESPHRQRLLEAMMNGNLNSNRNTPTPPPIVTSASMPQFSQPRLAPTPPPTMASQQQQHRVTAYEPQYLLQQQGSGQVPFRPAYESGFVVPQGYDATQMPAATANNPGYDRPIYETNGSGPVPYDSSAFGAKASSRRESSIFPGGIGMGLNSQGARSRLREENRY
ncbi:rhogap with PH domain protein [Grosmannia clavigera kw1407]|uniref:Rhogap with PH domain protein n=1 Tax=Grosmannia clavigera (strain kw1407 / UAMH 11150) TaxID=655863 RepID=F0XMY8_GROCL|nr:rhogap with PH domain protein [Grosmannia clavigera kw1407]EFX00755.1 rhogap with PH domain protein [Grosmannia clavigera kw1407]